VFSQRQFLQLFALESTELISFGKHPAGHDLLEGGRNSLLESAQ
jgi:hypothetical protein